MGIVPRNVTIITSVLFEIISKILSDSGPGSPGKDDVSCAAHLKYNMSNGIVIQNKICNPALLNSFI
jgi:hypothetical protein